jgi:pimeloyl-ACP methyl ester carboxylesterase
MTLQVTAATLLTVASLTACGNQDSESRKGATMNGEAAAPAMRNGYASVNGLRMYYEIQGSGRPLLLLHGGITTIEGSFERMRPALAKRWMTIAVEQQAHGRTADIDRPLTFEQEADDTAALLRQLKIDNADVFGFSDGGNVGLGLAIRHPDLVRKLAIFGTNVNNDGLKPEILEFMRAGADQDPAAAAAGIPAEMRDAYIKVAPRPQDWPILVSKVLKQAVALKGWRPEELKAIKAPVMVMIGDDDIIRPEHAVELFQLLPHGRLAVLPGTDHFAPVSRADWLTSMVTDFFEAPMPKDSGETR